jgi:soluble lytic murein transglycosylase
MAAHARLKQMGHSPMPPLFGETRPVHFGALPVTLPQGPRLFHEIGLDATAEERLAAIEQEAAQIYPSRESEALCEMYGMLSGARRRHQVGSRAVSHDTLMRPPSVAELWAWRCVYPSSYPGIVQREENRHGIPAGLVHGCARRAPSRRKRSRRWARGGSCSSCQTPPCAPRPRSRSPSTSTT